MLEVGKKRAVERGIFHGMLSYLEYYSLFTDLKFIELNAEILEPL